MDEKDVSIPPIPYDNNIIADAPSWVKPGLKCTLYIRQKMPSPLQGKLHKSSNNEWSFIPGRKTPSNKPPIDLPNFSNGYARHLTTSKQLMKGYQRKATIIKQQQLQIATSPLALHVSAVNLHSHLSPSSLKHHQILHPDDKEIWDEAYREEYEGFLELGCFDIITEREYQQLKHILGSHYHQWQYQP